jgi:hypothetical protein
MAKTVEIENIEEMRRQEGIDDVELRAEIRGLKVGDFVKLTLLIGTTSFETRLVRITSIRGSAFRGKMVTSPTSSGLSKLDAGAPIAFTTAHIHSLLNKQEVHG